MKFKVSDVAESVLIYEALLEYRSRDLSSLNADQIEMIDKLLKRIVNGLGM